jgi:hypothetical protein
MHNLEKLKTLGDCYVAVSNVSVPNEDHASGSVAAGLDMISAIRAINAKKKPEDRVTMRIGIHTGSLLAGVIQAKSYIFDCWGETLAIADKLQESGQASTCHVSHATWERTKDKFPYRPAQGLIFGGVEIPTFSLASSICVTATLGLTGIDGGQRSVSVIKAKKKKGRDKDLLETDKTGQSPHSMPPSKHESRIDMYRSQDLIAMSVPIPAPTVAAAAAPSQSTVPELVRTPEPAKSAPIEPTEQKD